jgi:hypothetical protein
MVSDDIVSLLKRHALIRDAKSSSEELLGAGMSYLGSYLKQISNFLPAELELSAPRNSFTEFRATSFDLSHYVSLVFHAYHQRFYFLLPRDFYFSCLAKGFCPQTLARQSVFAHHVLGFDSMQSDMPTGDDLFLFTIIIEEGARKVEAFLVLNQALMSRAVRRLALHSATKVSQRRGRLLTKAQLGIRAECYSIHLLAGLKEGDQIFLENPQYELFPVNMENGRHSSSSISLAQQELFLVE